MKEEFLLREVTLFRFLDEDELELIRERLRKKKLGAEKVIFSEGEIGKEMYLIGEGEVEISLIRGDMTVVLTNLYPYSFFGEMALLTEKVRSATARTLIPTTLYVFKRSDFFDIYKNRPEIAAKLLLALAQSLSDRILNTNANLETYFLINKAIVDNEEFRKLYISAHKEAPSSNGKDITLSR